jgi:hypothetical protein
MGKIKITKTISSEPPAKELTQMQRNVWSDFAEAHPKLNFDEKFELFSKTTPKSGIDKNVLRKELDQYLFNVNRQESKRVGLQEPLALNRSQFGEKQPVNTGDSFLKVYDDKGKVLGRHNKYGELEGGGAAFTPASIVQRKDIPLGIDPKSMIMENEQFVSYKHPQSGDIYYTRIDDIATLPEYYNNVRGLAAQQAALQSSKRIANDEEYKKSLGGKFIPLPVRAAILKK